MKGVSPLVATVLLIAFTIGVGGVVSVWLSGFTTTSIRGVDTGATNTLVCSEARIALSDLSYCNNRLSGIIRNTGKVTLGNITLQELFSNQSTQTFYLCKSGSTVN